MKVIAAVFVSSIVLAGGAWAANTQTTAGPTMAQFKALKAQVAALQTKDKALTAATATALIVAKQLETFDSQCLNGWKSVKEYGGFNVTFQDNTTGTGTGLDWTAQGDTGDGFLPLATSDCTNKAP
jgi:outer membrane murein-binding lipoprotein Lpp